MDVEIIIRLQMIAGLQLRGRESNPVVKKRNPKLPAGMTDPQTDHARVQFFHQPIANGVFHQRLQRQPREAKIIIIGIIVNNS